MEGNIICLVYFLLILKGTQGQNENFEEYDDGIKSIAEWFQGPLNDLAGQMNTSQEDASGFPAINLMEFDDDFEFYDDPKELEEPFDTTTLAPVEPSIGNTNKDVTRTTLMSNIETTEYIMRKIENTTTVSPTEYTQISNNATSQFMTKKLNVLKILKDANKLISSEIDAISEPQCRNHLQMIHKDILSGDPRQWVLQIIDSSFKIKPGLMQMNFADYGNPEGCLKVKENSTEVGFLTGKYCILHSQFKKDVSFSFVTDDKYSNFKKLTKTDVDNVLALKVFFGICVPSSCSAQAINQLVKSMVNFGAKTVKAKLKVSVPVELYTEERFCYGGQEQSITTTNIVTLAGLSVHILINLFCTVYDTFKTENTFAKVKCFSLRHNGKILFSPTVKEGSLTCLNGLKAISIMFILLGHKYLVIANTPTQNNWDIFDQMVSPTLASIGVFCVEIFFVISGLLPVYTYLNSAAKLERLSKTYSNRKKNWICSTLKTYLARYIRLVPVLGFIILVRLNDSIMCQYGSPVSCSNLDWSRQVDNCHKNWWVSLLFVQNFVNGRDACIGPSWYLAVDTQLFLLIPFIIYACKWNTKLIISLIAVSIVGESVCLGIFSYIWEALPLIGTDDGIWYMYRSTQFRFYSWAIGIILGYVLCHFKLHEKKTSQVVSALLWTFSSAVVAGTVYYIRARFIFRDFDLVEASIVNATLRQLWAVAISIIIFLCATGNGGFVNSFLSWPLFTILGRLTYSMYLSHWYLLLYTAINKRTVDYVNQWDMIYNFLSDYTFTVLISVPITLLIEMPFASLGHQLLFKSSGNKESQDKNLDSENKKSTLPKLYEKTTPMFLNNKKVDIPE